MKLNILAFAAHPDDVELSCAGTIIKHVASGKKVGIIDISRGELGTRGTAELRASEAGMATGIMGVHARENLGMRDGFIQNDEAHQLAVIRMIRKYQPEILIGNAIHDRHPDHGKASRLIRDASFLSGLLKIKTIDDGAEQDPWRPRVIYYYIQDSWIEPDVLIDVSDYMEKKMEAIRAFQSQFYNKESVEPATYLSRPDFLDSILFRSRELGKMIGVKYAEGFTTERKTGVESFFDLI